MARTVYLLAPLAEIAPLLRHPVRGLSAAEMRARCPGRSEVRLLSPQEGRP